MGNVLCRAETDRLRACRAARSSDTACDGRLTDQWLARLHGVPTGTAFMAVVLQECTAADFVVDVSTVRFSFLSLRAADGALFLRPSAETDETSHRNVMFQAVPLEPRSSARFLLRIVPRRRALRPGETTLVDTNAACLCTEDGCVAARPLVPNDLRFVWSLGVESTDTPRKPAGDATLHAYLWNHGGEDGAGVPRLCVHLDGTDQRLRVVDVVAAADARPQMFTVSFDRLLQLGGRSP